MHMINNLIEYIYLPVRIRHLAVQVSDKADEVVHNVKANGVILEKLRDDLDAGPLVILL